MAKVLITGANGFVGVHIADGLKKRGIPIVLGVRSSTYLDPSKTPGPVIEYGDLNALTDWSTALTGVTHIVHTAGLAHRVKGGVQDDHEFLEINAYGTKKLVHDALQAGVKTFINISSIGAVTENASKEIIDDESPPTPANAYGQSKLLAETYVQNFAQTGLFGISLRPPLIIGASSRGNWRSLQRLALSGVPLPFASIKNQRSLLSIDNLVEAIVHLIAQPWPGEYSGNYAIADKSPISLQEIIATLRAGMNKPSRLFPVPSRLLSLMGTAIRQDQKVQGLIGSLIIDPSRFQSRFGFEPIHEIKDTIFRSGAEFAAAHSRTQK